MRWVLWLLLGCSSTPAKPDGAIDDSGITTDDATMEAASDAPVADGGGCNNDILGTFETCACPLVSMDLTSPMPSLREDGLAFTPGEMYTRAALSPGGQTLYDIPNAGGSSIESEIMSFEILHFCEGATLLKTETQIAYAPPDDSGPNTITDLEVEIGGKKVGVSVTRGYFPKPMPFTVSDAKALLEKKLIGVNRSSMRVLPQDKWVKQILHVFVADQASHDAVVQAWPTIDPMIRADTIVLLTKTTGGGFIYCNPDPPLGQECP